MGRLARHGTGDSRISVPSGPTSTVRKPDPEAWALALGLADGDAQRLEVSADGRSIKVHNA